MNNTFKKFVVAALIVGLFVFPMAGRYGVVRAQDFYPPTLDPNLSADGLTLDYGLDTMVIVVDPNPAMQGIKIPLAPELKKALSDPAAASATFSFTFVAAGGTDFQGQVCTTFPENAKTAFNAAADIWASTIQSSVPITIQACWASLADPKILGYAGGAPLDYDFSGAPLANTIYKGALANALHGSDLDPSSFDMKITYNSNFTWYYGTDGNPPAGQYDLVMIATHEIAHGLNFSGSASYSAGTGSYGYGIGYPNVYDTFIEDSGGAKLTSYSNPSAELGTLLTSDSLWFNGSNANAGNLGTRVKMYAPGTWKPGSSYSHLDYDTFAGTDNNMMVYAIGAGSANHNPGPITKGLLKDLGWAWAGEVTHPNPPTGVSATDGTSPDWVTISWSDSPGATSSEIWRGTSNSPSGADFLSYAATDIYPYDDETATPGTIYWYFVKNCNIAGCSGLSSPDSGYRSTQGQSYQIYLPLVLRDFAGPPPGSGIVNGGFESGTTGWTEDSLQGYTIIDNSGFPSGVTPHGGSWMAWLGGIPDEISKIGQQVTISAGAPYLTYYHWIDSVDSCGLDFGTVHINGTIEDAYDLCTSTDTGGWVKHSVDLSAFAGQSVWLQIGVVTDSSVDSSLFVDDVSLQASALAPGAGNGIVPNPDAAVTAQGRVGIVTQGEKP